MDLKKGLIIAGLAGLLAATPTIAKKLYFTGMQDRTIKNIYNEGGDLLENQFSGEISGKIKKIEQFSFYVLDAKKSTLTDAIKVRNAKRHYPKGIFNPDRYPMKRADVDLLDSKGNKIDMSKFKGAKECSYAMVSLELPNGKDYDFIYSDYQGEFDEGELLTLPSNVFIPPKGKFPIVFSNAIVYAKTHIQYGAKGFDDIPIYIQQGWTKAAGILQ